MPSIQITVHIKDQVSVTRESQRYPFHGCRYEAVNKLLKLRVRLKSQNFLVPPSIGNFPSYKGMPVKLGQIKFFDLDDNCGETVDEIAERLERYIDSLQ